jgi:glycerophosphoryl diester phosphodiesterase
VALYGVAVSGMKFLGNSRPLAFAHRGGAGDWPENSMPAFDAAVAMGFTHLETDVHATSDGVLVAFHDDKLDRVTDMTGSIAELPWSEVTKARIDGKEPIPRFDELLERFPDAFFNVDTKADPSVGPLIDLIARTGSVERLCVGSFSDRRLARIRKAIGPRLCTSMGPAGIARLRAGSFGVPVGRFSAACAQVPPSAGGKALVDERFVTTAHALGIDVHIWTIDEPEEMHRLFDLGVDGIMTDRPGVLKEVMIERNIWSA